MPDVDKAGILQGQPVPPGPAANDNGCWAATAANILAAGGWGTGANAQARANSIYQDFVNNFKTNPVDLYLTATGDCPSAAMWWLANIGTNPAYAGAGFSPATTYVNFRVAGRTLNETDYNFLLDELKRCQYVGVKWNTGADTTHGMTLVGGNYGPNAPNAPVPPGNQVSVWHNSDNEGAGTNDEVYINSSFAAGFPGRAWQMAVGAGTWTAEGYWTECPGAPKPVNAITTLDVHRYIGLTSPQLPDGGNLPLHCDPEVQMRTTGTMHGTYAGPGQQTEAYWDPQDPRALVVPNKVVANMQKRLYVLIDFNDPLPQQIVPDIFVVDDQNIIHINPIATWAADNGEVMLEYDFPNQPAWEKVVFPGLEYVDLMGVPGYNVLQWDIATECTPEPATLALLGVAAGALLALRRWRRA